MIERVLGHVQHRARHGALFRRLLAEAEARDSWSLERLRDYQTAQLRPLIEHCAKNVPYYRDLFARLGLTPRDLTTAEDLTKLPLLTKADVAENFEALRARGLRGKIATLAETSGTTGTPGRFLRDRISVNFENATLWKHYRQVTKTTTRRVSLRGAVVVPMEQQRPPYWKEEPGEHLLISSYHLSLDTGEAYLDEIDRFRPAFLLAYPSTAATLAQLYRHHRRTYPFQGIVTSSETVLPHVRTLLQDTFGTTLFDWYGQAERVAALGQCRDGRYHVHEGYGICEFVDSGDGTEIVGTTLHNYVMPLLRYQTGDFCETPETSVCACGRASRHIAGIQGRSSGAIITPEGRRITALYHHVRGANGIVESQFYQDRLDTVELRLVVTDQFTDADRSLVQRQTEEHLSAQMTVVLREVDQLITGPNNKYLAVVSRVADPLIDAAASGT